MKAQATEQWWTTLLNLLVLTIVTALLTACGGGGGGSSTSGSTSGLSSGQIEGFGSVIVNGVKFEVEGAEVEFEHGKTVVISSATQTLHLNEGMQVKVEGSFNSNGSTGTASRIIVDDELEGAISGLTVDGTTGIATFTVLSQTVVAVPGQTHVDDSAPLNSNLSNLQNGQYVEVHGLPDGNGTLQATFIEYKAADQSSFENLSDDEGEYEVTGAITAMGAGSTFNIGSLLVDYSGTTPDGPLAVGTLVEVKGALNGSTLEATRVHVEDGLGDDVAKVEVEGLIRDLDNPVSGQFTLNGQIVDYSSAIFIGGLQADLINGLKVEAEGPIDGGVLFAVKVKFKDSFRYEGMATANSATQLSISVPAPAGGTLTVYIDTSMTDVDLESGHNYATDPVKIRARIVSGSTLVATRLNSGGDSDRQEFEAPVVAFSQASDTVELLDDGTNNGTGLIVVDTSTIDQSPPSDFEVDDVPVSRTTFYANLHIGDRVDARYRDGAWDEIEIEDED
jgi:hypothetical protein